MNRIQHLMTLPEPYRSIAKMEIAQVILELTGEEDSAHLSRYILILKSECTDDIMDSIWPVLNPALNHINKFDFWRTVGNRFTYGMPLPSVPDFYKMADQ